MDLQTIKNYDSVILCNYLKPDINKPNHFLANTETSMHIFDRIKKDIFTFEEELYRLPVNNNIITSFVIKGLDTKFSCNDISYKECLLSGKQYEEVLTLVIQIIKKKIKINEPNNVSESIVSQFVAEIKIPLYVGHGGSSANKQNLYPEALETGGFFVTKNNIKKYVVFKQDRTCTSLRYRLEKTNSHHGSFNSVPFRFIDPLQKPQFLTLDLNLNLNKLSLYIKSEKTLPSLNIILLVSFLTGYPLDNIKDLLLSRFQNDINKYDNKISDVIEVIFFKTKNELKEYEEGETNKDPDLTEEEIVERYINTNYYHYYKKNKTDETNKIQDFVQFHEKTFVKLLLPSTNSYFALLDDPSITMKKKIKGMTILYEFENFLIASFQNKIYPDKYHLANRRIASPGTTFEVVSIEIVKNIINDYKEQIVTHLRNNSQSTTINFKPYRKVQNVFNNIFNMQDKKHSIVIKPQKTINYAQRFNINNLVVLDSAIRLTKYFNCRDPSLSTWYYMGPVDTPDHGENVGINRRLNVGTKINDKDFETHRKLAKEISDYVNSYIEKHSKLNENICKDMVNIILVDESEVWIGCIEQTKIEGLYKNLKEKKITNIFQSNLIDIALIPLYNYNGLKTLFPIKKYRTLRINIGNKIPFMPAYIVDNGELLFTKINIKESLAELAKKKFEDIITTYSFMEYLGPEEFLYSDICESISVFQTLSLEERKKYSYVGFDNTLNVSILEAMIFDMGKMPGTRGIFSSSQLKNNVSSIQPDSLNIIEASKFTISGFQEPCITNDILVESRIPKQSFGTHIIVAFMAYNHNIEDSFIVNEESVKNGMFVIVNTQLYKGSTSLKNTKTETSNIKYFRNSYSKLDEDFVPKENVVLEQGDALYGDTEAKVKKSNNVYYLQDNSIPYKFLIPGRVDRILLSNDDSSMNIRYTVATTHFLERGHKMSNQCAQKGTVSKIAQAWELPYNINGVRPDLLLNSLSKIGRKTVNMYYQTLITNYYNNVPYGNDGKKQYINYKPFSDNDYNTLQELKTKLKEVYPDYSDKKLNNIFNCNEILFDPYTGEALKYDVFMGPIYFNRLTQISDEKISVHNRGRLNKLNQPPSGKQKGGSHRLGEMEMDILATHGVSNILYEVSKDSIEAQLNVNICQNCTNVATSISNGIQSYLTCLNCENLGLNPVFEKHNLTKVAKILISILNFRGVKMTIKNNPVPTLYPSQM
ncbi:putative RNA polymerase 132 kDa subunit [Yalta virus]|nr:putative RNA polymerase 132 kDa subunit [Yalta virus]